MNHTVRFEVQGTIHGGGSSYNPPRLWNSVIGLHRDFLRVSTPSFKTERGRGKLVRKTYVVLLSEVNPDRTEIVDYKRKGVKLFLESRKGFIGIDPIS